MTDMIDLRSDTVTQPSAGMRAAMASAVVGDDVLDGDPTTRELEARVASLLGMEAALFFPTGSMANQAAVWVQTTPGTEILLDADAHIVHWELAGAAALAGVQIRPVRGAAPVMTAMELETAVRAPSAHAPETSLVCLENTHNGAGGMVTPLTELRALREVAVRLRVPVHLDGARLWNAHIATGETLADLASCADTVMVSFSKGLGAPVGAALAGSRDVIVRAHRARKRLGGGMRQSGVLAAAALYGLDLHLGELARDHEAAVVLAAALDGVGGARVVAPQTNIVMVDLARPCAAEVVTQAASVGVRVTQWTHQRVRLVTHRDVSAERVAIAAARLGEVLGGFEGGEP